MATEIDPLSMLEVSLSEKEGPGVVSLGDDKSPSEPKSVTTKEMTDEIIETIGIPDDSPFCVPLNLGWRRDVVLRANSSKCKADVYYRSPQGKRCRSLKEVAKLIVDTDLRLENFTFCKKMLGVNNPEKEFVRNAKDVTVSKRGSLDISLETVDSLPKKAKNSHKNSKKKTELVDFQPDQSENVSKDDCGGLESENEETDSKNVLESLHLIPASTVINEPTSSNTNEPSSTTNIPSSTTSEPELDCLTLPIQSFCSCDMCSEVDKKCLCCWNIPSVQMVKSNYQCITLVPVFKKLILDTDVLSITRHLLSVKTKNKKKEKPP